MSNLRGSKRYGKNWYRQKQKALERDNYTCQKCGKEENLDVHHKEPFVDIDRDKEGWWKELNDLDNLVTLCRDCHFKVEKKQGNRIPRSKKGGSSETVVARIHKDTHKEIKKLKGKHGASIAEVVEFWRKFWEEKQKTDHEKVISKLDELQDDIDNLELVELLEFFKERIKGKHL